MIRLFLHARWYSKVLYCCSQEKKVYDGYCKDHVIIKSPWSTYYIHSLLHVFLISIFPYISYFEFLIQGLRKGEIRAFWDFRNSLTILKIHSKTQMCPRLASVSLTISYHLDFLRISLKFGAYLHHGSMGRVQSKECYFKCTLTF